MPAGRLGHIANNRKVGHIPINGIRSTNYAYGVPNILARWKAGIGQDNYTNGGSVTTWDDVYSGYRLTGVAANLPTYTVSNTNFNNNPTINVTGNQRMTFSLPLGFPIGCTLVVVFKINTLSSSSNDFLLSISPSSFGLAKSTGATGEYCSTGSNVLSVSTAMDTAAHISFINSKVIYRDGSIVASGSNYFPLNAATGLFNTGASLRFSGEVAEFFIIENELTAQQYTDLYNVLNALY
jgi:hypothetical protein